MAYQFLRQNIAVLAVSPVFLKISLQEQERVVLSDF